jgi:hypothetical protein
MDTKIPNISQFWGAEHKNDIKNWKVVLVSKIWKGSHKHVLLLRAKVVFDHSQSQSQYHVINIVIDFFVCGAVGVLLVARQLCYLCRMCAVCSEMYFSLNLYFRWIQMPCRCVKSVDNVCYRCGETILTKMKKWTAEYRNISSATCPLSLCEGVPIPETPKFFPTLWWGRGNVSQETLWPSTLRSGIFVQHTLNHRHFWPHQGPKNVEE